MNSLNFEAPQRGHGQGSAAAGENLPPLLCRLDPLPLECDGMARVLSTLLTRDDVPHQVAIGSLSVNGVGTIDLHWWIELSDGRVCDLRARMWLGSEDGYLMGALCQVSGTFTGPEALRGRSPCTQASSRSSLEPPRTVFLHGPNKNCNGQSDKEALADC